ncbi:hypothetical protein [Actinoplanes sp. NPDC020271]|uniref:hypothetical protein n=1 Tax=Actinoplanes sp. NPDC020271 TaxID=3363896 RepID=UPI00379B3942
MTFPYARTFDEVLAYVKKRRCVCRSTRTEIPNPAGERVLIGGVYGVRYDFYCVKCARLREFTFRSTDPAADEPPAPSVIGLVRSTAEAHLFMDLHECEICAEDEFDRRVDAVTVHGELCSRYTGACAECGNPREFTFRLPEETLIPDPEEPSFGGERPSELLDAGEWLAVADAIAACTPADPAGLDAEERLLAHYEYLKAAAVVAEARKFVAYGAEVVSPQALWSSTGRAVHHADPGRFDRRQLERAENVFRDLAVAFGD